MISLVILCWMRLKFNRFTVTGVCGYRYWMTRCSTLYTAISSVCWVQCFDLCLCLCREQSDREQALEDFKTGTLCAYACDFVCVCMWLCVRVHVTLCVCVCVRDVYCECFLNHFLCSYSCCNRCIKDITCTLFTPSVLQLRSKLRLSHAYWGLCTSCWSHRPCRVCEINIEADVTSNYEFPMWGFRSHLLSHLFIVIRSAGALAKVLLFQSGQAESFWLSSFFPLKQMFQTSWLRWQRGYESTLHGLCDQHDVT